MVPALPAAGPSGAWTGLEALIHWGRSQAAESRPATLMLFEGQDLGQVLATWSDGTGSAIIVVKGR